MADTKITALAAIATVDPAADVLPIVDISDTSMAASGTTKKVTTNQILQAGGTATLASATITGDLTVDTSTLKVDSTNNRVGIGTASPSQKLTVSGTDTSTAIFTSSGAATAVTIDNTNANAWGGNLAIATGSVNAGYFGTIGSLLGTTSQNLAIWATSGNGIVLHTNNSGTAKAIIDTNGVLLVGVTSANANGGVLQLKSGITFPATQVAASDANTLDDYEEGTFVPTQGAGLTVVGAFSSSGTYTKVGRLVTITGILNGSTSIATAAVGLMCSGLPFSALVQVVGGAVNQTTTASADCVVNNLDLYSVTAISAANSIRFSATYPV